MLNFDRLKTENHFKWIPLMMYHSLVYVCNVKEEVDFDLYDVIDLSIITSRQQSTLDFNNAFTQSLVKNVPNQPEQDIDTKKK